MSQNEIVITNRHLCKGDFKSQLRRVAQMNPKYMILREKDMTASEYEEIATEVIDLLKPYDTELILHSFVDVAKRLNYQKIHLPMEKLKLIDTGDFELVGASTHTVSEAIQAQQVGADYITASHIFATNCKKGVPPRGLDYLREVVQSVSIPVYALGGITPQNAPLVMEAGASGYCMMSYYMK